MPDKVIKPYNESQSKKLIEEFAMKKNERMKTQDLEELKRQGASFIYIDQFGNTAILWSIANGHFDGAMKIIEVGPSEQLFIQDKKYEQNSPLHLVLAKAYTERTGLG